MFNKQLQAQDLAVLRENQFCVAVFDSKQNKQSLVFYKVENDQPVNTTIGPSQEIALPLAEPVDRLFALIGLGNI